MCWFEAENGPIASDPSDFVHPLQTRTRRAKARNNRADSFYHELLSFATYYNGLECFAPRRKIKRNKCRCAYYANSTATFHCPLEGDLIFKLNPGPEDDPSVIHTLCFEIHRRHAPLSTRSRHYSNLITIIRTPLINESNTYVFARPRVNKAAFKIPVLITSGHNRRARNSLNKQNLVLVPGSNGTVVQDQKCTDLDFCFLNTQPFNNKAGEFTDFFCETRAMWLPLRRSGSPKWNLPQGRSVRLLVTNVWIIHELVALVVEQESCLGTISL